MVQEKKIFVCEICDTQYSKKKDAEVCENKGWGKDKKLPIGLIFSNYDDIVFAIAKNRSIRHDNFSLAWACRDNGAGDNMEEYCNGISLEDLKRLGLDVDTKIPAYKRMIKGLKAKGIKPILAKDYLKSLKE